MVAVTGIGVVAPGGIGVPAFWDLLTAGRTATRGITLFDPSGFRSRIAAECDFDPAAARSGPADSRPRTTATCSSRWSPRAEAVRDAGLDLAGGRPVAVRGVPGHRGRRHHPAGARLRPGQRQGARWDVDHRGPAPHLHRAFAPSTLASAVAELFGARRPGADRLHRLHLRARRGRATPSSAIEEGRADVCIAGASDSPISPITVACFDAIKATSPNNDDPEHASRPFDADRDGFVLGEGGAVLVLEELEHAPGPAARDVYCEIGGYATFGNAYHMTGLTQEGLEMSRAIDDRARPTPGSTARRSTTSTRTARAPSRTTGTRPPRSSGPWARTPTTPR